MFSVLFAAMIAAQATPLAEPSVDAPEDQTSPAVECCTLKALTPIRIMLSNPLASNTASTGQTFAFVLADPIPLDGGQSVPAGTPGGGEVVHASRSGMAGKAGELVLAARFLDYRGTRVPLRSMRFGKGGKDQTGTATALAIGGAVVPIASIFAIVITGGEVRIPAGAIAEAKISADTQIDADRFEVPASPPTIVTLPTSKGIAQ